MSVLHPSKKTVQPVLSSWQFDLKVFLLRLLNMPLVQTALMPLANKLEMGKEEGAMFVVVERAVSCKKGFPLGPLGWWLTLRGVVECCTHWALLTIVYFYLVQWCCTLSL